jgi:hypothetical protein
MAYEPATPLDDPVPLGFGATGGGPRASAGTYQIKLAVGGETVSQTFEVVADPRVNATREDLQVQFDLQIQVRDKMSALNEAVNTIRKVRAQADNWAGRTDSEAVKEAAGDLNEKLLAVEGELIQYRAKSPQDSLNFPSKLNVQLAGVAGSAGTAEGRPNAQTYAVYEDVAVRIDAQLAQYQEIIATDLPAFNALIIESDIDPVTV